MTTTITAKQGLELCDVSKHLVDLVDGIFDAVDRLLRMVGDLVGPASPDPESFDHTPPDVSGCERKRDSAQPSIERRKPWT